MAAASCLHTEDQFLCSICQSVFTDPVSIPCGHNFCISCITQHWNINVLCQCPLCKRIYNMRPELQVNTFICEMAAQFRQSAQQDDRMCKKHPQKLLELFCRSDQMCVCVLCPYSDHKTHDVVAMKEECEGKKSELVKTEAEIQQLIQKRRVKIEEMRRSVELSNKAADREMAEGVEVFTALKETVERSQAELIKTIKEKQRTTEEQAEDFITELEQEISDLKKRSSEVEQLSQSEDQLHLLQNFSSLITAPPDKDLRSIRITLPPYEMTKNRAVNQLEEKISKIIKHILQDKLKRVQQFTVNVTLDPDIVHGPNGQRINNCRCVSSTEGFTSGRFYFESQVERWSPWTLGVTTQTNIRRRKTLSPTNGFWTVSMKDEGRYSASSDSSSDLCLRSKPMKVGVFVDYEEGLVSFYDGDTAALIFSFTGCSFTGKLYPYFSPCPEEDFTEHLPPPPCLPTQPVVNVSLCSMQPCMPVALCTPARLPPPPPCRPTRPITKFFQCPPQPRMPLASYMYTPKLHLSSPRPHVTAVQAIPMPRLTPPAPIHANRAPKSIPFKLHIPPASLIKSAEEEEEDDY